MFCRFCATPNPEGSKHCRACSAPLAESPSSAPSAPPPLPPSAPPGYAPPAPSYAPQPTHTPPWASSQAPQYAPSPQQHADYGNYAPPPYASSHASPQPHPGGYAPPAQPVYQPAPQAFPTMAPGDRTLAQIVASRGGGLGDGESLRYVEAVARALAHELGRGRAPHKLDPERIVVKPNGGIDLHLEWQDMHQPPRQIESHLAHELERLSQFLRGHAHAASPQAAARPQASSASSVQRVSFFDTAREMMRGALMPFAVPQNPPANRRPLPPQSAPPAASHGGQPVAPAPLHGQAPAPASTLGAQSAPSAPTPVVRRDPVPLPPPVKLDFDSVKSQIVRTWARGKAFKRVGWAREGRELWACDDEDVLSVWNIETGSCLARMEARFRGAEVTSVAFMGREEMVATGHDDGRVCFWMPRANRLRASLEAHSGRTSALCYASSATGRPTVFSGGGDGILRAWDALDGKGVGTEVEVTMLNVRESAVSSDGQRIALGGDGGRIEVWRFAAARMEWESDLHEFWITALAFSPEGRVLASGGYDRAVRLWSGASGALGREFKVHEAFVTALRWAPAGDLLFSLSCDGALWMHDWRGSRSRQVASEDGLQDFIVHPDGRHFAAASHDGLSLWRLE